MRQATRILMNKIFQSVYRTESSIPPGVSIRNVYPHNLSSSYSFSVFAKLISECRIIYFDKTRTQPCDDATLSSVF